jgi:hypothetical protein
MVYYNFEDNYSNIIVSIVSIVNANCEEQIII